MKNIGLLIISLFLISSAIPAAAAGPLEDKAPQAAGEFTVGVLALSPPEEYVVVEEVKTKKKRLYKKDIYEAMKKDGLNYLQTVLLGEVEYRYKPVSGDVKFISEEFELVELKDKKAVLKKEHLEKPEKGADEIEIPMEEELPVEIEDMVEEAKEKRPAAKRLVASLFSKIESKKLSDNEWEISLPTIVDAAANFSEVLGIVVKKIGELIDPEKSTKVYLKSSLGKGELGPSGLLINSLNSSLREKSGIEEDDLIKTVNGKNLNTIQDVAAVFSTFAGSPQTFTVGLVRDEEELTHTYYLK